MGFLACGQGSWYGLRSKNSYRDSCRLCPMLTGRNVDVARLDRISEYEFRPIVSLKKQTLARTQTVP